MENKLIKKFCKSNKNGILSKNKPEGILNYISFYKENDSDELKPRVITFKKSLNKKKRYNLCKDNACREDEYVVKNLSIKKVKKLLKNIDDFSLANIRKQLDLENRVSSKIKYVKHSKKNKAKKFRQCRKFTAKKVSVIDSKKIQKKKRTSKTSNKRISFDFFRRIFPKAEKTETPKVIKEVIQQKPPTPNKKNTQEIEKLRNEQKELVKKIEELKLNKQNLQKPQTQQEQQLPNNNGEKQKYIEKIKGLESKLEEVASYGEKKSGQEKELKQKIEKTKYEYEKELQRQKQKLQEETEKRRKLEYNRQYSKSKQGSYNSQLSQYKRELATRKARENRLRRERNQYRQYAESKSRSKSRSKSLPIAIAKPFPPNPNPNPNPPPGPGGPPGPPPPPPGPPGPPPPPPGPPTPSGPNGNNNSIKNKLLINAFDIFVVDFKTISTDDVNEVDAVKSHIELLKKDNEEKKIYLFNVPKQLLNEDQLQEHFIIDKERNTIINYSSSANYNKDEILNFATYKIENKGKRTLLICSNEMLFPSFNKNPEYKNIDGILLRNNIDDLFTIKKESLKDIDKFVNDTENYTYYDNDNSITAYNTLETNS